MRGRASKAVRFQAEPQSLVTGKLIRQCQVEPSAASGTLPRNKSRVTSIRCNRKSLTGQASAYGSRIGRHTRVMHELATCYPSELMFALGYRQILTFASALSTR